MNLHDDKKEDGQNKAITAKNLHELFHNDLALCLLKISCMSESLYSLSEATICCYFDIKQLNFLQ
jgi:hypothetical protein